MDISQIRYALGMDVQYNQQAHIRELWISQMITLHLSIQPIQRIGERKLFVCSKFSF